MVALDACGQDCGRWGARRGCRGCASSATLLHVARVCRCILQRLQCVQPCGLVCARRASASRFQGGSLSICVSRTLPQGLSYENGTTLSYTSGCFLGFTSRTCHVTSSIEVVAGQLAAAAAAAGREAPQLNEMSDMPGEACC